MRVVVASLLCLATGEPYGSLSDLYEYDYDDRAAENEIGTGKPGTPQFLTQSTIFCDSGQNSYSRPLSFVCIETTEQTYYCCYKVLLGGELFSPLNLFSSHFQFFVSDLLTLFITYVFIQKLETTL